MVKIKIITDNAVYIQLKDLRFLYETEIPIPGFIMAKMLAHNEYLFGTDNEEDFLCFIYPEDKVFFNSLDFIVDYKDMVDLEINQLCRINSLILEGINQVEDELKNNKDDKDLLVKKEALNYKLLSVCDFIYYKIGEVEIPLPNDIKPKIKELRN